MPIGEWFRSVEHDGLNCLIPPPKQKASWFREDAKRNRRIVDEILLLGRTYTEVAREHGLSGQRVGGLFRKFAVVHGVAVVEPTPGRTSDWDVRNRNVDAVRLDLAIALTNVRR